jgi:hypothetical protein
MKTYSMQIPQLLGQSIEYLSQSEAIALLDVRNVTSVKVRVGPHPSDITGFSSKSFGDAAVVRVLRHGYAEPTNPLLITLVLTNIDESGAGFTFESPLEFVWPQPRVVNRSDAADAARLRWMLAGNGYFMEEQTLCGHAPQSEGEQDAARALIDAEMRGQS